MRTLLTRLFLSLGLFFAFQFGYAQDCGCDFTIEPTSGLKIYDVTDFSGIGPGSVICMKSGNYGTLRFTNLQGSESNPITIKNCGGQVVLDGSEVNYGVLQFNASKFIHLTGTGHEYTNYGIFIKQSKLNDNNKSGLSGVIIGDLSTDFEVDHLEIQKTGFAGIIAKTDPRTSNCDSPETQATFRANFTLKNLHIHHNYIHNTGGEGMYIGSTWGFSTTSSKDVCNGYAHLLENIEINNNRIEQSGWDAIQLSLAYKNAKIHDNEIVGYGFYAAQEGEGNQSFGIALGGGTKALVYNNKIIQMPENTTSIQRAISGINVLTGTMIYNNLIVGPGYTGIWMHLRYVENGVLPDLNEELGLHFMNNTIVRPGVNNDVGLGIYVSTCQPGNQGNAGCRYNFDLKFVNNIVVEPKFSLDNAPGWMDLKDVYIQLVTRELRDSPNTIRTNNLYVRENPSNEQINLGATALADIKFVDPNNNNYMLQEGSVAIDAGMDLTSSGVNYDLNNNLRPNEKAFDIGAYEFGYTLGLDDVSVSQNNNLLWICRNPIKDNILSYNVNIEHGKRYLVEVYTIFGSLIYREQVIKGSEVKNIDLNNLIQRGGGTLLLKVIADEKYQAKLVVTH